MKMAKANILQNRGHKDHYNGGIDEIHATNPLGVEVAKEVIESREDE